MKKTLYITLFFSLLSNCSYANDLLFNGDSNSEFLEKFFDQSANKKTGSSFNKEEVSSPSSSLKSEIIEKNKTNGKFSYEGEIEWKKMTIKPLLKDLYSELDVRKIFVDSKNNIWEKNLDEEFVESRGKTFNEASKECKQLNMNGLGGFRLPSKGELEVINDDNFPFSKSSTFFSRNYWSSTKNGGRVVTLEKYKNQGFVDLDPTRHKDFRCVSDFLYSLELVDIAEKIAHGALSKEELLVLRKKPDAPETIVPPKFLKGEFETSGDFEKRVSKEKSTLDKENKKIIEKYNKEIDAWGKYVKLEKASHENKIKLLNENVEMFKKLSIEKAIVVKYGNPYVKSILYDADLQEFKVKVASDRSSMERDLGVKVGIEIAKEFKNAVLDDSFHPKLLVSSKNNDFEVLSVSQFDNPQRFLDKYKVDKVFDDIAGLTSFVDENTNSPVLELASNRLEFLIKEKEDAERKERETKELLAEKKKEEEARKNKRISEMKKNVSKNAAWVYIKSVKTNDCLSLFIFEKCLSVSYSFNFYGNILSVDEENEKYNIEIQKANLNSPNFVSMKYLELKNTAISWKDSMISSSMLVSPSNLKVLENDETITLPNPVFYQKDDINNVDINELDF